VSRFARLRVGDLRSLVEELRAAGTVVIAPRRLRDGALEYAPIDHLDQAVLDGPLPRSTLKRFFLPPTEPLFGWSREGETVHLHEAGADDTPRLVLGARPCDAAALPIVDRVMGWDVEDEPWFTRRRVTTVIGLACQAPDESCLCDSLGLSPDARMGSDLMLRTDEDGFAVEVVSEVGQELVDRFPSLFSQQAGAGCVEAPGRPSPALHDEPLSALGTWLEEHFDDPLWQQLALPCHGCGACAAVCPTCHCFDIVDEPDGVSIGTRRRNWDTCQSPLFTVHASGHNPRADQSARLRQRLLHKLSIYPRRFGAVLCTGCGRCRRACAAGIDLGEILELLRNRAASDEQTLRETP